MTEDQLLAELASLGLTIESRILPGTLRGYYRLDQNLVVIHSQLSYAQRRSTLAHELIHAIRHDDGHQPPSVEQRVNQEAAKILISPSEYELAERLYGASVNEIARELDVTPTIISAYREVLARVL